MNSNPNWKSSFHELFNNKPSSLLGDFADLSWFFIVGFISGFLFKHLGKTVLLAGIILFGILWILSYFNIVFVNMPLINDLFGLNSVSLKDYINVGSIWLKTHISEALVFLAGFISAKITT